MLLWKITQPIIDDVNLYTSYTQIIPKCKSKAIHRINDRLSDFSEQCRKEKLDDIDVNLVWTG